MMEHKNLVNLERRNACWRMDRDTFSGFMSYILRYFRIEVFSCVPDYNEIQYVEIPDEYMHIIGLYFGIDVVDEDLLSLAPVFPDSLNFFYAERQSFILHICEKTPLGDFSKSVLMENR